MCRTRRIKVRQPHANASSAPEALALSRCPPDVSCSAMRQNPHVFNAKSLDANVRDTKMTSTSSFVTKPKPQKGGLAGQSIARRSNLIRGTATKLMARLQLLAVVTKVNLYLVLMQHLRALFQPQSLSPLRCKHFITFFQTTCLFPKLGQLGAI
jgi:hypothetical protein